MDKNKISEIAKALYNAEETLTCIRPITETYPDMALEDSYQVQLAVVEMKQKNGQKIAGKKVGLTNKAVQ